MVNVSWSLECEMHWLERHARAIESEMSLYEFTPEHYQRLETVIGKLIAIAVKHKPKETADAV
jgi:hypothetical protein